MRNLLTLGLCAFSSLFFFQQPASAWINFKFSAGVNWHWQSADNCLLWGLFTNHGPGHSGIHPSPGPGAPYHSSDYFQPYELANHINQGHTAYSYPNYGHQNYGSQPMPVQANPAPSPQSIAAIPNWQNSNVYQSMSYSNPGNYNPYYNVPSYPAGNFYYYQNNPLGYQQYRFGLNTGR